MILTELNHCSLVNRREKSKVFKNSFKQLVLVLSHLEVNMSAVMKGLSLRKYLKETKENSCYSLVSFHSLYILRDCKESISPEG